MDNDKIKENILNDLENNDQNNDIDALKQKYAEKYDTSENMIEKIIAEWEAGREKV